MADSNKSIFDEDVKVLHSMGYAQELARRMSGFSNFAVSFSLICILAGGITAFPNALSAGGPFSATIGWLIGGAFAVIVASSMGQIASAYPTAGGLYHWSSILGGRGWGWATAWLNLVALIFVIASVDVGVYQLFRGMVLGGIFGVDVSAWAPTPVGFGLSLDPHQSGVVLLIVITQALLNHFGIRLTTLLTDFSGYLIFAAAIALTVTMLVFGATHDFRRILLFTNNTGKPGGAFYPQARAPFVAFLVGLLYPLYTISGFDASAHISEETVSARTAVPRAMLHSVVWSVILGFIMAVSFITAVPDLAAAAKEGSSSWFTLFNHLPMPQLLRQLLIVALVIANYLCALAAMTSTSRMVYAFARDQGLPFSRALMSVSHTYRTPVRAIWFTAFLSFGVTIYSPAFAALSVSAAVFLYMSYAMPIAAGLFAEGKRWKEFGPFQLGRLSKPFALVTVLGVMVLMYAGMQPPSGVVAYDAIGLGAILFILWIANERRRFKGPPTGDAIAQRKAEIAASEIAMGGAMKVRGSGVGPRSSPKALSRRVLRRFRT
jgi:amino acid transporter